MTRWNFGSIVPIGIDVPIEIENIAIGIDKRRRMHRWHSEIVSIWTTTMMICERFCVIS